MPGFMGTFGKYNFCDIKINNPKDYKTKSIISKDLFILQHTNRTFEKEKILEENSDYLVLTEGILLNLNQLMQKYDTDSIFDTVVTMYIKCGNSFCNEFRGSFSGVLYDKRSNKVIIYTDHIGEKQLFYSIQDNGIIFSSDFGFILNYYKEKSIEYSLNINSAYQLLTIGFMIDHNTLINEINRLLAGQYLLIQNDKITIETYYTLRNEPNYDQSEDTIIDNIDYLFRNAIKRAFEKDREYGYKHLVGLSGGLDSRMTTWIAHDLGYGDDILNYTFSQSGCTDENVPKKITADLKHHWIFKSLDNGLCLKLFEDVVGLTAGGALYSGQAHSKNALGFIDKSSFGIIHTGQLGDVILGTFYSKYNNDLDYLLKSIAYSTTLFDRVNIAYLNCNYENEEIFKFYTRGFLGANEGLLICQETNETYSPFYDVDFLNYCLTIPPELRMGHKIYFRWILKKYPKAAAYKWERINAKITDRQFRILGRQIALKQIPNRLYKYVLKKTNIFNYNEINMNPYDYWYKTNSELRNYMDNYYNRNFHLLDINKELKNDCCYLYNKGNCIEKSQVLTLLAFLYLFY